MRKVIVSNFVSLDGFIGGPSGEIDWFAGDRRKYETEAVASPDLFGSVDTMLFGRVTYELMAGYWPTAKPDTDDPRIIEAMNSSLKIVFSKSLNQVSWKNTRLVRGDAAEEVSKLKRQPGKDMIIFGSGGIVSALAPKGLIDDYRLFVVPVVLGEGKPLFGGIGSRLYLTLTETKAFRSGLVLLRYEPERASEKEG